MKKILRKRLALLITLLLALTLLPAAWGKHTVPPVRPAVM